MDPKTGTQTNICPSKIQEGRLSNRLMGRYAKYQQDQEMLFHDIINQVLETSFIQTQYSSKNVNSDGFILSFYDFVQIIERVSTNV
jgi:hypothetical protein